MLIGRHETLGRTLVSSLELSSALVGLGSAGLRGFNGLWGTLSRTQLVRVKRDVLITMSDKVVQDNALHRLVEVVRVRRRSLHERIGRVDVFRDFEEHFPDILHALQEWLQEKFGIAVEQGTFTDVVDTDRRVILDDNNSHRVTRAVAVVRFSASPSGLTRRQAVNVVQYTDSASYSSL